MGQLRIGKLMREFNTSIDEIIDFLNTQHLYPKRNPNAKIELPDDVFNLLNKQFGYKKDIPPQNPKRRHRLSNRNSSMVFLSDDTSKQKTSQNPKITTNPSTDDAESSYIEDKPIIPTSLMIPQKQTIDVRIKAINRPFRIITNPIGNYECGVIFPKNILFKGKPVPISLSEEFIPQYFKVGDSIHCHVIGSSTDGKIAYLKYNLPKYEFKNLYIFNQLTVGKLYSVNLASIMPNHFLVKIADTDIHGIILKNQIDDDIKPDRKGSLRLQLVEKPDTPLQLLRFVKPITVKKHAVVENLDEIVNSFLTKPELDAITPEDLEVVKSILSKFPKLKRKQADQITDIQLYCRIPEKSQLNYFIKKFPDYISDHSFWVSVNMGNEDEPSIVIFKESPTLSIELKAYSDDVFTVTEFDFLKNGFTRNILQKYNKRTRLKIDGKNLHFVTLYDPVPVDYNTEDVIDFLRNLYDFNSSIIPSINESIREKTLISAKDYSILSSFLKYQRNKEFEKEGEIVFIAPNRISTASVRRIGDYPSLRLMLNPDEVNTLMGLLEEENSAPHVAVVDDNGNEMLTGVLDTDGEGFILRSDHDHVDWTEYLNSGIRLQHRANIKHIQIQMNAIEDFIRRDSLKIYQDLINNRLETPDMSKAEGVIYKNPLFNTSAGNNTQSEAVKKALGNKNVLLIQGPPGTGKTTIIVEIIEQLVARGKKVLVCSQAHAAVKNIYDRLQARCPEMDLLTLDEKDEVTAAARKFDDEAYTEFLRNNIEIIGAQHQGKDDAKINALINSYSYKSPERTKNFREKHHHVIDFKDVVSNISQQKIVFLLERLKRDTKNLNTDLLKAQIYREKDVILGTCIGIGMDPVMRDKDAVHFDTVIVDEAGKANLAETIVPMQLGDRFILVGDHRQLPPYFDREEISDYRDAVVNNTTEQNYSQDEVEKAMNKSLFSDFFDHQYFPAENKVTLNYQFRMNPQIGQYISDLFYGGQLFSGEGTEKQTVSVEGYPDPVTFVNTFVKNINEDNDPRESKSPDGSWFNMREVKDICEKILPRVSETLDSNSDLTVGIITPYRAQYRKLCEALKDSRFKDSIYTIDSIQGSEFDIVVFSFVRAFSNHSKKTVGFLDDLRRLNVSLSRAKKKLILVGHLPTLKNPDAHIDTHIPGMVSPVEVFSSIANRIKRFGELDPIEQFMALNCETGHVFNNCEYHDDGQCYIVIHLDGFDLESRVPRKAFSKFTDGDAVDIVLSGFDATGRPQFDSLEIYNFKQNHVEGETYNAIVSRTYTKENGQIVVYAEVDGFELPMRLPAFIRDEHPEYTEIGTKLPVQLGRNDDDPDKLFFNPTRTEAERIISARVSAYLFSAEVVEIKNYPLVTFRCKDGSQLSLGCHMLWHTAVEGVFYDLVKFPNGNCNLHNHYFEDFLQTHKKGVQYNGLVVSDDKFNYYIEVDEFCGIVEKQWNRKKYIKRDAEYPVEISWIDNNKKLVKFKFV